MQELEMRRLFAAPRAAVFTAWTDADWLRRWAWGSLGNDVKAAVDLRVGGRYRISTRGQDGEDFAFHGEYLEIVPQERLAYTVEWDAPMGYEAPPERVDVDYRNSGSATDVFFRHFGVPTIIARDEHEKGWNNTFDMLAAELAKDRA
jgi:uncharacterized protein YndB with AHSA1/START domain